ncbi:13165_t:CDS:2 [Entrophospora sp. SA101]|nr:13165_t:CDS:2 [Entrophospora sp. SA101]
MLTQCEKIMIKNSTINLKPLTRTLRSIFTSSTILLSSLPAFAHFISNNLSLIILSIMSPPTFTYNSSSNTISNDAGTSVYTEFIMKDKFGACSIELVASSIIKVSGNITKVYASSMAMFFSSFASYFVIKDYRPTIWFFSGTIICCIAVQMYTNGVSNGSKGGNGNSGKGDENSNNHNHNRNSSCIVVNNVKANYRNYNLF